ncbi:MAG: hypothetical protein BAJATHORv1_10503 [Candidatus Thorarchaeota archaeon]|nr:MAG: hypothetical protein BAJATHORv1_10503 [Candidatus Thorarchaeota archaeon]
MSEITEYNEAITYEEFLKAARENVEIMKARFNDLMLNEHEQDILRTIQNRINILVIGTDRCNDTAGNLPVLARMASLSPKVELRILDSDKHARFHQNFRVNGKRKTPVVLFLNEELQELCRWAERPNTVYKLINEKSNPSIEQRKVALKKLYSDPEILRQSLHEFLDLLLRSDYILGRH